MIVEPKRQNDLALLWPPFRERVERIFAAMRARGFDPIAFETLRTQARQSYLYGIGRTHHKNRKPVTWAKTVTKHRVGKAVDVISKKRGWNWSAFFRALKEEARREGCSVLAVEQCHVEWRG